MIRLTFLAIFFIFFINLKTYSALYSISDLEVLHKQQAFEEFLQHAKDIVPSERTENWNTMTKEMAIFQIDNFIKTQKYELDHLKQIDNLLSWPIIRNYEPFLEKRVKFLNFLFNSKKIKDTAVILNTIEQVWNLTPPSNSKIHLGLLLGQIAIEQDIAIESWKFFSQAAHHENAKEYCQNKWLKKSLLSQINTLSLIELSDKEKLNTHLLNLAFPECWRTAKEDFLIFSQSVQGQQRELILTTLNHFNLLSQEEYDYNLILYLLEGPIVGPMFNYAWSRAKFLGENFKARKKILTQLTSLSLLPDYTFGISDKKKRVVIINYLQEHFPEFFDYYEESCINYLKGVGNYPFGNPTLNCKKYFDSIKNEKWLKPDRYQQYQDAIKIGKF